MQLLGSNYRPHSDTVQTATSCTGGNRTVSRKSRILQGYQQIAAELISQGRMLEKEESN